MLKAIGNEKAVGDVYKRQNSTIAVPLFVFDGKALKLSKWPNSNVRPDWPTVDTVNRGECTR